MSRHRRVAHLIRTWLPPSETFVHGQVLGAERWQPFVVARRRDARAGFADPPLGVLATTEGLPSLGRARARLAWRLKHLSAAEARATARRVAALAPAVVHAHFGTDARFFLPLWSRLEAPLVVSFYGYDVLKAPRSLFGLGARYLRPVLERAATLIAASEDMRTDLVRLGADPARVVVLPWGVDLDRFRPVERAEHSGPVRFGVACRFTEKKGLPDLLAAFAGVRRAGVEARLVVAGSGPHQARLRALAAELGIDAAVEFPGFVAREALPALLAQLDVFVHPSVTAADGDKEGTPTVLMEAAAAGLPIVATRHAGIPEVVPDGVAGHLVEEHDVVALTERMIALARDFETRRRLGAAAREHVRRAYDARARSRERERLYDRLAGFSSEPCTVATV